MTTGAPAGALAQQLGVGDLADVDLAGSHAAALNLGVASEAEVRIGLGQKLAVQRAMRIVAGCAAFTHRLMLKNEGTGLFAMTLLAALVHARHCEPGCRFENVAPVRVVALGAIHAALRQWVMLRQAELRLDISVALI